jgi:hypothetical protein
MPDLPLAVPQDDGAFLEELDPVGPVANLLFS